MLFGIAVVTPAAVCGGSAQSMQASEIKGCGGYAAVGGVDPPYPLQALGGSLVDRLRAFQGLLSSLV